MVVSEADPASQGLDLNQFRFSRVGNPSRVARPEGRQADIGREALGIERLPAFAPPASQHEAVEDAMPEETT